MGALSYIVVFLRLRELGRAGLSLLLILWFFLFLGLIEECTQIQFQNWLGRRLTNRLGLLLVGAW